jgi:hypothetical protein
LEFLIEFDNYGRTSNLPWHKENTFLSKEVSPNAKPSKELLKEVKRSSEVIHILSPSMTMTCSLKGTSMEALHNLTVGTNIMSQFIEETLLGNMLLVPTDKLFKSPSGLIFECCGIARAVPMKINETEVCLENFSKKILPMGALMKSWEQLLPPLLSVVQKIQRRSNNPTITCSRR